MFGFTINMITLMALSLCVGLLIDDAIVVRENIVRHVQMGKTPYQASLDGTQEIGLAVLATTFSIVAVFLPIGFMGGIIGKFFHEFGVTIVAAVLISCSSASRSTRCCPASGTTPKSRPTASRAAHACTTGPLAA
jgi:HAE1 family hydrophobic/amphiphilic exporter-1